MKRDALKGLGMTNEEIDAKLPLEPVPKTGFNFGAVMGKRLIDYGIMSSSTDSDESDAYAAEGELNKLKAGSLVD